MLKRMLSLALAVCMTLALAACGGTGKDSSAASPDGSSAPAASTAQPDDTGAPPPDGGEKVTLTLSTFLYVESPHRKAIDALLEAYNAINPNVQIEVSGTGYADFWNTLTSEILANNETDIIQIYPENVSQYHTLREGGTFVELDDRIAAAGLEGKLVGQDTALYEGRNVALSNYSWGTTGLFYRKSMLQDKGIDPAAIRTQEDFREACLKFVEGDNAAMGVVYSSHGFVVSEWSRLLARPVSNGLFFQDGETGPYTPERVNINAPGNVWAAQWWNDFIAKDKAVKLVPDKKDSRELFWNGNVPFNMDGPWFIGMTRERDAALMDDIGIIPQFDVVYEGETYKPNPSNYPVLTCISKNCENVDAAWDFLSWMASDEAQKIIEVCGQIPSSIEYSNSDAYKSGHELEYSFVDFIQNYYAPLVSDPAIPQYGEINQVMIDTAQVIFGETPIDVKPELDKAQADIEAIMAP